MAGASLAEAASDAAQDSALICGARVAFGYGRPVSGETAS
jgi:hypothetical protein